MKTVFCIIKKTVFLGLILVTLIFVLACIDQLFIGNQYSNTYNASLVDKMHRLKNTESPKIVLIGNSNLAFGIDSQRMEEELGMPVVNMGFLGSLGNEFHERMILGNIGEDDMVVISHTTYSDDNSIGYAPAVWITLDCNRQLFTLLRPQDYITALPAYPNYLRNAIFLKISGKGNMDTKDSYSRNAFNEYGDDIVRVESSRMNSREYFENNEELLPEINDICVKRLNALNDYVEGCGATMMVAGFPIAVGEYTQFDKEDINTFQKELGYYLDCNVVSNFEDYMYSYDLFYDQMYHLNEEGVAIRTEQLIDDLKELKENDD